MVELHLPGVLKMPLTLTLYFAAVTTVMLGTLGLLVSPDLYKLASGNHKDIAFVGEDDRSQTAFDYSYRSYSEGPYRKG